MLEDKPEITENRSAKHNHNAFTVTEIFHICSPLILRYSLRGWRCYGTLSDIYDVYVGSNTPEPQHLTFPLRWAAVDIKS